MITLNSCISKLKLMGNYSDYKRGAAPQIFKAATWYFCLYLKMSFLQSGMQRSLFGTSFSVEEKKYHQLHGKCNYFTCSFDEYGNHSNNSNPRSNYRNHNNHWGQNFAAVEENIQQQQYQARITGLFDGRLGSCLTPNL